MSKIWLVIIVILLIAGGAFWFSQNNKPTSTQAPVAGTAVTLTKTGFSPETLTVKVGDTVTWTNKSGEEATVNSDPHPIHTNYSPLNLGSFAEGGTLSLKFDKAGTYSYHNHLNPNIRGTILVQ